MGLFLFLQGIGGGSCNVVSGWIGSVLVSHEL
jgi:hypothetical protein